jgi:hypothetical protein
MDRAPYFVQELVMRHQVSRMLNQISRHRERLGRQWYSFIWSALQFAPETFVDEIKSKRRELFHIPLLDHIPRSKSFTLVPDKNFLKTE